MYVYSLKKCCSDTYVLRTTEDNTGDEFEWSFS